MTKTPEMPRLPETGLIESSPKLLESGDSTSQIAELYGRPEFRLAWDNDLPFHIARFVGRLRHYRGLTQTELAEAAGTTQARIARIEGADQNITLKALMRLIEGLRGRVRLSIEPAELEMPRLPHWWECLAQGLAVSQPHYWTGRIVASDDQVTGRPSAVLAGWTTDEFMKEQSGAVLTTHTRTELPIDPGSEIAFSPEDAQQEQELLKNWSWS